MKFFHTGAALVSALTILLGETVVRDVFALDTVTSNIVLAQNDIDRINPQKLVTEALQIVENRYLDGSFNGLDWQKVKAETLNRQYNTSEEAYQAIDSVLSRLDNSSTRVLTPEQFAGFLSENSGQNYVGVGLPELLALDYDERTRVAERRKGTREFDRDNRLRIITPMPDSPAAAAGLKPGDLLSAINGVTITNLSLAEAAMKLRGAEDSAVNLTIDRDGSTFDVELKREKITVTPTVRSKLLDSEDMQVGYIYLGQLLSSSPQEMRQALNSLQNATVLILDLRNNPGGLISATTEIAGFFLGESEIGTAVSRVKLPPLKSTEKQLTEQPLVVLVNQGTASAAELLVGSLQDSQRAIVVGVPTTGKGIIHSIEPLSDESAMVVSLGKLFTPNQRDILASGIEPDILVNMDSSPLLDSQIEPASSNDIQYLEAVKQLKRMM